MLKIGCELEPFSWTRPSQWWRIGCHCPVNSRRKNQQRRWSRRAAFAWWKMLKRGYGLPVRPFQNAVKTHYQSGISSIMIDFIMFQIYSSFDAQCAILRLVKVCWTKKMIPPNLVAQMNRCIQSDFSLAWAFIYTIYLNQWKSAHFGNCVDRTYFWILLYWRDSDLNPDSWVLI